MYLNLAAKDLERIIEALQNDLKQVTDQYLIDYLKTIKKNHPVVEVSLDEIPFWRVYSRCLVREVFA